MAEQPTVVGKLVRNFPPKGAQAPISPINKLLWLIPFTFPEDFITISARQREKPIYKNGGRR